MAKKKAEGYLSAKESRLISKQNRKITNEFEKKRKRKNVPESEYLTTMKDPNNAVEFDNLHTMVWCSGPCIWQKGICIIFSTIAMGSLDVSFRHSPRISATPLLWHSSQT